MTFSPKLESLRECAEALARVAGEDPTRVGAELSRAGDTAERSPRLRVAVERSQMLIRRVRTGQGCAWANRAWLDYTGADPRSIRGTGWLEHVHPDDREACVNELRVADDARGLYRAEYRLRDRRGAYAWVLEIGAPRLRRSGGVLGYLTTAIVLGERRSVRESAECSRALVAAAPEAIVTLELSGTIVDVNPAAERCFGRTASDLVGRAFVELIVPPRFRAQVQDAFERYRATGDRDVFGARYDCLFRSADGADLDVEFAILPIDAGGRRRLAVFARDAVERNEAERLLAEHQARLRALTSDLLVAEERERRRLALDLHDGLTQLLALLQLKNSALRSQLDARHGAALDEFESLIRQANVAARSLTSELSPPMLHDLGLEPAVHWLIENVQQRYGIQIEFEDDGAPKPTSERVRVILFRSIRELLINAAKHARASKIVLRLRRRVPCIEVDVEDDGIGMEPESATYSGCGLFGIRERIGHVGGSIRIDSTPGAGTRVYLSAPLESTTPSQGPVKS